LAADSQIEEFFIRRPRQNRSLQANPPNTIRVEVNWANDILDPQPQCRSLNLENIVNLVY